MPGGPPVEVQALRDRTEGRSPTGTVFLRDFTRGVMETLGAVISTAGDGLEHYYLMEVPNVSAPPGLPGVPVSQAYPEDVWKKWVIPAVVVRLDDFAPAMHRWHPGTLQYRAPSAQALRAKVTDPWGSESEGYDRVEELQQAVPYDLTYTISIVARLRGGGIPVPHAIGGLRNQVDGLVRYVLRIYQPYGAVFVTDSIYDKRSYDAYQEGIAILDEVPEVVDRLIGFAVTLRIEGELDLNDPVLKRTVTSFPITRTQVL